MRDEALRLIDELEASYERGEQCPRGGPVFFVPGGRSQFFAVENTSTWIEGTDPEVAKVVREAPETADLESLLLCMLACVWMWCVADQVVDASGKEVPSICFVMDPEGILSVHRQLFGTKGDLRPVRVGQMRTAMNNIHVAILEEGQWMTQMRDLDKFVQNWHITYRRLCTSVNAE